MLVSDFAYDLPEELIAQQPAPERAGSRMLALDRTAGTWQDTHFTAFPQMLRAGDVLVLNNTRVIPARLFGQRVKPHTEKNYIGKIEVLLTAQLSEWEWKALVRPGKKVHVGERLRFLSRQPLSVLEESECEPLEAEVMDRGGFGERVLRFTATSQPFLACLENYGHIPLPPYIRRPDHVTDRERYQTVYSAEHGSVAVPTAGLHFTSAILDQIRGRGVRICYVTLHVGLGTFQPLRVDRVEDVQLHSERYTLPDETAAVVNRARSEGQRIVAAGTTTVRTLEHCAQQSGDRALTPHSGSTQIFISPGYRFRLVDALLTNFHLPQSSLLMLVSAFAGLENTLAAYRHAVADRYRFFSYGDCMFIS
jgi:S-adenosylmethionine:tRNA ribosyltransferase-isomerase